MLPHRRDDERAVIVLLQQGCGYLFGEVSFDCLLDDGRLELAPGHEDDTAGLRMVAMPMVMASRGTWEIFWKSWELASRVELARGMRRVRE